MLILEIYFHTKKWNKTCNNRVELNKAFPTKVADTVALRITQLKAADNLSQISHVPPIGLHKLKGSRKNQFAVWTKEKYRIIFQCLAEDLSVIEDTEYPKEKITKISIIEVVNYHG